ncbi:MAG: hypothetical protein AB8I08_35140 [Sandaracinaceae bacterium]
MRVSPRALLLSSMLLACSGCSALYGFDYTVGGADAGDAALADAALDAGASDGGTDAGRDGGNCEPGLLDCGSCVDPTRDPDACGACDVVCEATDVCFAGRCQTLVSVAGGQDHTCALGSAGTLQCWGDNRDGQLGTTGRDQTTAAAVGFFADRLVTSVGVGGRHTCAITDDDTLWCWGNDDRGQLGLGNLDEDGPAEVAGLNEPVEVVAGERHTCVRQADHRVFCFGDNTFGQLGDGTFERRDLPEEVIFSQAVAEVLSLRAGGRHTCAILRAMGDAEPILRCWGDNRSGQLGVGDTAARSEPWQVTLADTPIRLATGVSHTCVVTGTGGDEGALHCFGAAGAGQLGDGDYTSRMSPVLIDRFSGMIVADVVEVVAGRSHTCATRADGALYCWGSNRDGQLGDAALDVEPRPSPNGREARHLGAGQRSTCAVIDRRLQCWGWDGGGAVGVGATIYQPSPMAVPGLSEVQSVAVSDGYGCAVHGSDGLVSCFGASGNGQLGGGRFVDSSSPVPLTLSAVTEVSLGLRHGCALLGGSTPEVHCWGANAEGQLGQDDIDLHAGPVQVPLPPDETPVSLGVGLDFSCAAVQYDSGTEVGVDCWGVNREGQLGRGSVGPLLLGPQGPVVLPGMGAEAVVRAGDSFACAERGGLVSCWGGGADGRLGVDVFRAEAPMANGATGALALDASGTAGCAVGDSGMQCWGANPSGLLGALPDPTTEPMARVSPDDVTDVSIGARHACVLAGEGDVYCAGSNAHGELGDGGFDARASFVQVALPSSASQVAAGAEHTCAVVSGSLYCWGHDRGGRLGSGRSLIVPTPTPVRY